LKKLFNLNFFRNTLVLLSGHVFNQLVLIISYPIISRLYQPEQFGIFAQVNAIYAVLLLISTLRYESAIIISIDDNEAKNLLALSIILLFIFVVITFFCLVLFADGIADLLKSPRLKYYIYWIPLFILLASPQQIFYNWSIRKKEFKRANISNILKSSLNSIGRIIFGIYSANLLSLFLARSISLLFSMIQMIPVKIYNLFNKETYKSISRQAIIDSAKNHKDFPLFMSGGELINRIATSSVPLILSSFFGVKFLGFYAMANTALNIPLSVLRNSLQTVFMQEASERRRSQKTIFGESIKISGLIFISGLIPLILLILFGPEIFRLILGLKWEKSGEIAQILIPWFFMTIVAAPYTALVPVMNLQKYFLIFQSTLLATRILLIIGVFFLFHAEEFVLFSLMLHGVFFNLFHIIYVSIVTFKIENSENQVNN